MRHFVVRLKNEWGDSPASASKDGRTKSAKARITFPGPEKAEFDKKGVAKEARERAKSAKAIREKHLGSTKIFPRPPSRSSKGRFTTLYCSDFDGSFVPPAELRPTSPTRRNNPHPGKVRKGGGAHQAAHNIYVCSFILSNSWCGEFLHVKLVCLLLMKGWYYLQGSQELRVVRIIDL